MKKIALCLFIPMSFWGNIQAQDSTISVKITPETILNTTGNSACKCIDSINTYGKSHKALSSEIDSCIHKYTDVYLLSMQLLDALKKSGGKKNINLKYNLGKKGDDYSKAYHDIQAWLMDSCASIKGVAAINNQMNSKSVSNNPEAMEQYRTGIGFFEKEEYALAIGFFKKAVALDSNFAFAWDNLGICYRKTEKYKDAIAAYNKSLSVDPKGVTPLHNIPVVYEFTKEYDLALNAYDNILKADSTDPEGYYGKGRIYSIFIINHEKALDNFCKAFLLYGKINSPYKIDAEQNIKYLYSEMKKAGKESLFYDILKENNINIK